MLDAAAKTARGEHHDRQEHQTHIEDRGFGVIAEHGVHQRHHDGADDRAVEHAQPADGGHQQRQAGRNQTERFRSDDLVVDRRHAAGETAEGTGGDKDHEADVARRVTDELQAVRVITHGVGHAAQRRAGEGPHGEHRQEGPKRHEPVHVGGLGQLETEPLRADHAVAVDAGFTAEHGREHLAGGGHHFAQTQGDHGEGGAGAAAERPADDQRHQAAGDHAHQRHADHRDVRPEAFAGVGRLVDGVHGVHGRVTAEAEEHRVAEGQHAPLAEQHVVGQGEHDVHGDHVHQREGGAAIENEGQNQEHGRADQPGR